MFCKLLIDFAHMNTRLIILTSISAITSIIILIVILTCGDNLLDGQIGDSGAIAFYLSPKVLFFIGLIRLLFTIQTSLSIFYRLQELIYSSLLYAVFLIKSDYWELIIGFFISILILIFVAKLGLGIIKKRGDIKW